VPVAAAAPALILTVVLALLLVVLLVNVAIYQNGKHARAFALNLPVISIPIVSAIDWIIAFNVAAARVIDIEITAVLVGAINALGHFAVLAFNAAGAVILTLIHATAATAAAAWALAVHIYQIDLPAVAARVAALERLEGAVSAAVQLAISSAIALAVLPLNIALEGLGATQRAQAAIISIYRPLWDSLAKVPAGAAYTIVVTAAEVTVLRTQVAALQGQLATAQAGVSALERTVADQQAIVARLTALLAIAGAGAIALENLLRLGRDPCMCLTSGAFSDLPMRVEALENFGA
jgi:hypothetical protein